MVTRKEWTRDTPWRQGHLLPHEAVKSLGLTHPKYPDDTLVIVASHDCDLAQPPDKEPNIEIVVGHRIHILNGNNTHAKSTRTLHVGFEADDSLLAEFVVTDKKSISKYALIDFMPVAEFKLSLKGLVTFQCWLASRYRRSAFPDEFENRFKNTGMTDRIAKAVKPHGELITALFFDVDEGEEILRNGPDDIYVLDIVLLHATEPDFNAAASAANKAKEVIENAFINKLFDNHLKKWRYVELRYVDVISEETFTFRQSKLMKQWRLDHISLGADPQQPILAE